MGDISDISTQTEVINPKILYVSLLVVRCTFINFIEINDSFDGIDNYSEDVEESGGLLKCEKP